MGLRHRRGRTRGPLRIRVPDIVQRDDDSSDDEAGGLSSPDSASPTSSAFLLVTKTKGAAPQVTSIPLLQTAAPDSPSPTSTLFPAIASTDSPSPTSTVFPVTANPELVNSLFPIVVNPGQINTETDSPSPTSTTFALPPASSLTQTQALPQASSAAPAAPTAAPQTTMAPEMTTQPPLIGTMPARTTNKKEEAPKSVPLPSGLESLTFVTKTLGTQKPAASATRGLGGPPSRGGAAGAEQQLGGSAGAAAGPDALGARVGITVGTIAAVAVLTAVFFVLWKCRKRRKAGDESSSRSDYSSLWERFRRDKDGSGAAAMQKPVKTNSKILDDLISAAYAAEAGGNDMEHGQAVGGKFVMPNGFVKDEKKGVIRDPDIFLPNESVPQPSLRQSIASWIRGRNPLRLNPLAKRKSTVSTTSAATSRAPPAAAPRADAVDDYVPPVPPLPANLEATLAPPGETSRWSESTGMPAPAPAPAPGGAYEQPATARQTEASLYDLYARDPTQRAPSGLTWAMGQAQSAQWWRGSSADYPPQSDTTSMYWPPTPLTQAGPPIPDPAVMPADPTARWVELQKPYGRSLGKTGQAADG